jgi:uncharacterized DUF497 family protein
MADDISIEFDPVKDARNLAKHGISLGDALNFDWNTARIEEDIRFFYGEKRFEATGWLGSRLYVAVYCTRDGKRRMISLRKANDREFDGYVDQT